jgi:pilus assembly protein FimV
VVTIVKKSKVHSLTKTLAVVSLLAPASGYTLGIGEIKLHSALNQNLDAEIALILSGESVSDIKVNLAPPEKFDETGVAWTYFLSKIKLETVTNANGMPVIKLTSKEALKEPFLDFLLEVSWPKGSLYREFTVLVDPPSAYNQESAPVASSSQRYQQPPAVMAHANGQSSDGEYGPTLANDTLWSIAERVRGQSNASVEQMIIAIYEANPQAFNRGNVFGLTTGKMLKIPSPEAVQKLTRNQALAEFNKHKKAWRSHSSPAQAETKEKPADNQLTLLAPTKAAVTDHAVIASTNDPARGEDQAAQPPKSGKGKGKGKSNEAVTADELLQSKVSDLEKQLAMMQQLIALKDQQLAALQNKSQEKQTAPSEPVTTQTASEQASVQPVQQPNQAAASETAATVPANQAAPIPEQVTALPSQPNQVVPGEIAPTPPANQVPATEQSPAQQPAQPVQAASGGDQTTNPEHQTMPAAGQAAVQPAQTDQTLSSEVVTVKKPVDTPAPAPQQAAPSPVPPRPEPASGNLADLYLQGGIGAAVLSLLGGLWWWRKRKIEREANTESMFVTSTLDEMPLANENVSVPVVEDGTAGLDVGAVGESSFLSEFTPSDFDSFDTDQGEIDPISEADVYLAYGRYQQAEELIRQAIKD